MARIMTMDGKKIPTDAWSAPSWRDAAEQYDRDRADRPLIVETDRKQLKRLHRLMSDVSFERTWDEVTRFAGERHSEAPKATYDAVVSELRTHGLPQLKKQNCQQRLSDLSAAQIKAVMVSLQARRNQYPKVTDELLAVLAEIYKRMASHAQ
jgi:hypothetical protein